ncbi:Tetratricopeptide repeat protein [Sulfidibacter corallicola]|uniref:protein O-GlcNAc transferase n=1 Tax=Sulfidibacter corallicola TaxID=2818388 RepID=A0A8A4TWE9_SULCO|nr:glycosyltransferase family 41 protein [Sulfidibacter corallicola]QTD53813.1 tetratricopeptide repeat protein [Sulfidibacter corallicola]
MSRKSGRKKKKSHSSVAVGTPGKHREQADAAYQKAVFHYEKGQWDKVALCCKKAIQKVPRHADALHLLGVANLVAGNWDAARQLITQAIAFRSDNPFFHNSLGNVHVQLEAWPEAAEAYRKALELNAVFPDALSNLGYTVYRLGMTDKAVALLREALALQPNHADAANHLGRVYLESGQPAEALGWFSKAIAVNPRQPFFLNNLALTQQNLGRHAEAENHFKQALALNPNLAETHTNLGNLYRDLGKHQPALSAYSQAIDLNPHFTKAIGSRGDLMQDEGRWQAALDDYTNAFQIRKEPRFLIKGSLILPVIPQSQAEIDGAFRYVQDNFRDLANQDFTLGDPVEEINRGHFFLPYTGLPDKDLQSLIGDVYRSKIPALTYTAPHCDKVRNHDDGRIHIGFVSRYLRNHTIGKLFGELITRLPRDRFHVTLCTHETNRDALVTRLAHKSDKLVRFPQSFRAARDILAAERFDMLCHLDIGMDILTYMLAFCRLARIQLNTIGHPTTSGIDTIDYFVSSEGMEPEQAQRHYREKLLMTRVPATGVAFPDLGPTLKDRAAFGLDADRTYYICPQSLFKFHPDFDPVMAQILRRDQGAEILLVEGNLPGWTELLRARLQRDIPNVAERIRFLPRVSQADFIHLIAAADVMLDPYHFGGGMTSYEALAVGTPVVTLPGTMMRGRVTSAIYGRMGFEECVVGTDAEFVDKAIALANDRDYAEEVRGRIARDRGVIFEDGEALAQFSDLLLDLAAN